MEDLNDTCKNTTSVTTSSPSPTTTNSSSSVISKQIAALDDADVWIQQLVVVNVNEDNEDNDVDSSNSGGSSTIVKTATTDMTSTTPTPTTPTTPTIQYYRTIMNQIGRTLYELEYHILTCYCCQTLYHAPVYIESCQHYFCSYCIRTKFYYTTTLTSITYQQRHYQSCPICNCSSSSNDNHSHHSSTSSHTNNGSINSNSQPLPQQRRGAFIVMNGKSSTSSSSSSSSTLLKLVPHPTLDTFVHVFRNIRTPLLHVLQQQHQKLLQLQQQEKDSIFTTTIATKDDAFQYLPKLLRSIQKTMIYLQRMTNHNNHSDSKNSPNDDDIPRNKIEEDTMETETITNNNNNNNIELEVHRYIGSILKYATGHCYPKIPYPIELLSNASQPPEHRDRPTLTKVITNQKTTRKQYMELLILTCGFSESNLQTLVSQYTKYFKYQQQQQNLSTSSNNVSMDGNTMIMTVLRKMYMDYIRLYNSEQDTQYPRSTSILRSMILSEQMNIIQEKYHSTTSTNTPASSSSTTMTSTTTSIRTPSSSSASASNTTRHTTGGGGNECGGAQQPVDYHQCIQILKQQRKILGESMSVTSKFWTTVTTGNVTFDTELANNYQQLMDQYNQRFPLQYQQRQRLRQEFLSQYHSSSSKTTTPTPTILPSSKDDDDTMEEEEEMEKKISSSYKEAVPLDETIPPLPHRSVSAFSVTPTAPHGRSLQPLPSSSASGVPLQSLLRRPYQNTEVDDDTIYSENVNRNHDVKRPVPFHTVHDDTKIMKKPITTKKPRLSISNYITNAKVEDDCIRMSSPMAMATATAAVDRTKSIVPTIRTTTKRKSNQTSMITGSTTTHLPRDMEDKNSLIGPWFCSRCTYYNTKDRSTRARCEMCTNIRSTNSTTNHGSSKSSARMIHDQTKPSAKNAVVAPQPPSSSSQSSTGSASVIEIDC